MQPEWLRYRERGSRFAYRLVAWIGRTLGRRFTRLLLYPICLYYMLLSRTTVRASRQYLAKIFGRAPQWREIFRHHYHFAAALLDRVYLYANKLDMFDIRYHVTGKFAIGGGGGCLLLSAHMGSAEFMTVLGEQRYQLTVNMMMYEDNAQKIGALAENLDGRMKRRVIPIGSLDAFLTAQQRLENNEIVGVLADRAVSTERLVRVRFLGQEALFPAGPLLAAAALKVPVILFVCLYHGGNRYDIHVESFADRITLDRRSAASKSASIERWVQQYAERLEHYCRLAPYNWFNFYDFWGDPQDQPVTRARKED
jgi:predicted LPLAT superfamily acyltransferase